MDLETVRAAGVADSCHSKRETGSGKTMPIIRIQAGRFEKSVQDRCVAVRDFGERYPLARNTRRVFGQDEMSMGNRLVGRRLAGFVRHLGQGTALRINVVRVVTAESMGLDGTARLKFLRRGVGGVCATVQQLQRTRRDGCAKACFGGSVKTSGRAHTVIVAPERLGRPRVSTA